MTDKKNLSTEYSLKLSERKIGALSLPRPPTFIEFMLESKYKVDDNFSRSWSSLKSPGKGGSLPAQRMKQKTPYQLPSKKDSG